MLVSLLLLSPVEIAWLCLPCVRFQVQLVVVVVLLACALVVVVADTLAVC